MLRKKILPVSFFFAACVGVSQCSSIPTDTSAIAVEGNDQTIILQAPGGQSQKGYLFLQQNEGTLPSDVISLIVPKVTCKRDSCVRFKFFRKDGSAGFTAGIPKGDTRFNIKLSDIVGHSDGVSAQDEGEYSAVVQIYFLKDDGFEYSMLQNGFVRLNVLSKGYAPVGCNDPSVAWISRVKDQCEAQFTTAGRSAVCGSGCQVNIR